MRVAVLFFANTSDSKHDILVRKYIKANRKTYPRYIHCAVALSMSGAEFGNTNRLVMFESTLDGGNFTTDDIDMVKVVALADRIDYADVPFDLSNFNEAIAQYQVPLNLRRMCRALQGKTPAATCTAPANILLGTNALLCDDLHQQLVKRT